MSRRWKTVRTAAVLLFLALLVLPIPVHIERTVSAVELALDDPSFCEPVEVSIDGTYYRRLLGRDSFVGTIGFEGYPLTTEHPLEQAERIPALTRQDGGDFLDYGEWMDAQLFGYMSWRPFFGSFVVQVYRPHGNRGGTWSDLDGHCIVGEAADRGEALRVLKRFSNIHLPPYAYWLEPA